MDLRGNRVGSALAAAVLAALAGAYLWEVVTLTGVPVARDMQMFFVPQKHLLSSALHSASVPIWTPYIGTGAPFLANVQSGVFYPPHWLFGALPFFTAFNLLVVLHFVLGGIFAFLLGRRLGLARTSAFVLGASWMFGGYFVSLLNLVNALQGAAWAPALAWGALGVLRRPDHRAAAVLAVLLAFALLAGEPQTFLLGLFSAGSLVALEVRRKRPSRQAIGRAVLCFGVAGLAVAGLVMVQLLPTAELLRESGRGGGLAYGEASAFELQPIRLLHFLIPADYRDPEFAFGVRSIVGRGDPWLFSTYLGAVWPLLCWFAWRNRARRAETAVWSFLGLFGILVALGDHTPLFRFLFGHVPGFGVFRFPEKYLFLTAFGAALVSGFGVEGWSRGERRRSDAFFGAGYLLLAVLAFAAFRASPDAVRDFAARYGNARTMADFDYAYGIWSRNLAKLVLVVGIAVGLYWLHRTRQIGTPVFGLLLAGLITADLVVAHRDLNPVVEREFYETRPEILRHIPLDSVLTDYRVRTSRFDSLAGTIPVLADVPLGAQKWVWQQIMAPNVGQMWRVLQQDAWDAIKLRRVRDEMDLLRAIPDIERRWRLLRLESVRWVHSILDLDPAGLAHEVPLDTLPGHLYEILRPLPRAYVVPRAVHFGDRVALINAILSPEFEPRSAVALEGPAPNESRSPTGGPAGRAPPTFPGARIVSSDGEAVTVELEEGVSGYLVLTDSFYPGWHARVDGEERPIELANFFFRAVRLHEGDRKVVFRYRPGSYRVGRGISAATLAVALCLLGVAERRSRRVPREG